MDLGGLGAGAGPRAGVGGSSMGQGEEHQQGPEDGGWVHLHQEGGGGLTAVRVKTPPRMNITRDYYYYYYEASFMEMDKYCGWMLVRNLI